MRMAYFSAASNDIPSLTRAARRFRVEAGPLFLTARTRFQLAGRKARREFVRMALEADVVFITLTDGKLSCPVWDNLIPALKPSAAAAGPAPYLHIQPLANNADALELARTHSRGGDSGFWRDLDRYYRRGRETDFFNILVCLSNQVLGTAPDSRSLPERTRHRHRSPGMEQAPHQQDLARTLVRITCHDNTPAPPLEKSVVRAMDKGRNHGNTGGRAADAALAMVRELISFDDGRLPDADGFITVPVEDRVTRAMFRHMGRPDPDVDKALRYILTDLLPRLNRARTPEAPRRFP